MKVSAHPSGPPGESSVQISMRSSYQPRGDQPAAIEQLVRGIDAGDKHRVLLGVTGAGKTFTMAKVIEAVNRPALVLAHIRLWPRSSTRIQEFLSRQCRRIFRELLRLLPT